jgi:hypothetical protein
MWALKGWILPAMAERGYGWEKLFAEMLCQEYWAEARENIYSGSIMCMDEWHLGWRA